MKIRVVDSKHNDIKYTSGSVNKKITPGHFGFLTYGDRISLHKKQKQKSFTS